MCNRKLIRGFGIVIMLTFLMFGLREWKECDEQDEANDSKTISKDINIFHVWEVSKGKKEVIVGVIDSGIDASVPELADCLYVNVHEIQGNQIDDDNNGYIDDYCGWNFYDNNNEIYSTFSSDYHGTMISGIVAGKHTDNAEFGVAPEVKILPLKCFRGSEGAIDDIIAAIEYGYDMGVRIFNCSWDIQIYNDNLFNVMKKYDDAIFICAGGKVAENLDDNPVYPACFELDNVICVGAMDSNSEIYQFSGYGNAVDIYAPGEDIYCLMPDNTYSYSEGTSLATAYISGAVALLVSKEPSISVFQIRERLYNCFSENKGVNYINVEKIFFGY